MIITMTHGAAVVLRRLVEFHAADNNDEHFSAQGYAELRQALDQAQAANTLATNEAERDRDYWRQSAAHAETRSARLAMLLAKLTDETFDWAFSLCGEREGLDELRAECKAALVEHVDKGGATESPFTTLMEQLSAEDQPWLTR